MPRDFSVPHPKLTADLDSGETPEVMYAAWRYADRMFSAPPHKQRGPEIAALDVSLLSPRMQFLLWRLIVGQRRQSMRRVQEFLDTYPNLRPLEAQRYVVLEEPIWLDRDPLYAWEYFTKHQIYL